MASKDDEKTTTPTTSSAPSQPSHGAPASSQSSTGDQAPKDEKSTVTRTTSTTRKAAARKADEQPIVDPRLDNRTGSQRPPLEEFPAKPQQIDGPDVTDEPDRDVRPHAVDDDRPRKGMKSTGPHGLGDTADRV